MLAAPRRRAPLSYVPMVINRYPSCPKCEGQYTRQDTLCRCYQCSFEWDLLTPFYRVIFRAHRRAKGEYPPHPLLDDPDVDTLEKGTWG